MTRYICIGCAEVHNDNDYCEKDGDIILNENTIECLNKFLKKEYEKNLKEYPDAKRSFELYTRLNGIIREKINPCENNSLSTDKELSNNPKFKESVKQSEDGNTKPLSELNCVDSTKGDEKKC